MSRPSISYKMFTVWDILKLGRRALSFNLEFQRSKSWSRKQQQRLMDSLLNGYTIGSLVLKRKGETRFDVLDGQQRLNAIFEFFEGIFKTSADTKCFPDFSYNDLKKRGDAIGHLHTAQIYAIIIEGGEEQDVAEIFTRLQEGTPLNSAEKLNAYTVHGYMRKAVIELTKHRLFKKIGINNIRFSHRELCAGIFLLELYTNFENKVFPSIRFSRLAEMYEIHGDSLPANLNNDIKKNLNSIYKSLGKGDEAKLYITKKSDFYQIYLLSSFLMRGNYYVQNEQLKKFVLDFFGKVGNRSTKGIYAKYRILRGQGQTKENLEKRLNLILKAFFKKFKLKKKDVERLFTEDQKKAIYARAEGRCSECDGNVRPQEANYHHTEQHMGAGPTSIEHGALMHKKCHIRHHKKHGYKI